MPRYRDGFPRPKKEYHHGVWRIIWRWDGRKYSVTTSITDKEAISDIESYVRNLASQLASKERPQVTSPWVETPGIQRYLSDRYGNESSSFAEVNSSSANWLTDYAPEIKAECVERWAEFSISVLKKFDAHLGGIAKATPENMSKYLAAIADKHKTATRNRALSIFSRFFKWVVRTERAKTNPVTGIKTLKEERSADIVYCTLDEREEIIAQAKNTGRQEWIAIPIAFYAGLRREEIALLKWEDVRFKEGLVMAQVTKTGKPRPVPLNTKLEVILSEVPRGQRKGHVVTIPDDIDRLWRMDNLIGALRAIKKYALLEIWSISKPPPSRSQEYKVKKAAWLVEKKKRDAELKAHLERIGWNPFRHTFGSLLAQAGVSIDKISSWMGNTPEVCRRHYAQFIPRDRRDNEIDKL